MKRGADWQAALELRHYQYHKADQARIWPAHPGAKVVRGRALFDAKGPPDYFGTISGRLLLFDAKSTEEETWPISLLKPHQAQDLEAADRFGGFAFLAISVADRRSFVMPWHSMQSLYWTWLPGHKPGDRAPIPRLSPSSPGAIGIPSYTDWLPVIRELLS